ncbi:MAG: DUF433 domain-containing protein, partial [bacterium]|nr:DUF433 domain-containing protein [bacterium]
QPTTYNLLPQNLFHEVYSRREIAFFVSFHSLGKWMPEVEGKKEAQEVTEMGCMQWQERIISEPDVHHGDPCIKGTRIPVAMILGSLADRMTPEEIRDAYPQLTDEDIQAALAYTAEVMHQEILVPLPA